jgi:protein-disulfide isomerase
MTVRRPALLAALAAGLLAGAPSAGSAAEAPAPGEGPLPGIDLAGLSAEQRQVLADFAKEAFCYCGCPHTLGQCLREHRTCKHAPRMAELAARLVRSGAKKADLAKAVAGYYASFDRRARLDVERFGPARGNVSAPVSLVEVSDFTCPFCQLVRAGLEAFVDARADRVRLFYKPFPIDSHPGAYEAAQAAEWAREKGIFWPMHDALFENPGARSVGDLADLARGIGGDPADLRAALEAKTFLPRVRESQAEARAAGVRGTPTLFLNGRMLVLADFSEEGLEFTLQDEEEWQRHRGWEHD